MRVVTPVIDTLWIGLPLDAIALRSLASFLEHGHAVRLHAYNPDLVEDAPDGVEVCDASLVIALRPSKHLPNFSDVWRYHLLAQRGGCWVDLDVICLRPWSALFGDRPFVSSFGPGPLGEPGRASGQVLYAPHPGHPYFVALAAAADQWPVERRYGEGTLLIRELLSAHHVEVKPPAMFCPGTWNVPVALPESYGVHLWRSVTARRARPEQSQKR